MASLGKMVTFVWFEGQANSFSRYPRRQGQSEQTSNDASSILTLMALPLQSLIQRSYKDDVPPACIERFLPLVLDMEEENVQVTPCFSDDGINYMHIRHNNLYLLALSKRNSNAAEIIFFLHRLCSVRGDPCHAYRG